MSACDVWDEWLNMMIEVERERWLQRMDNWLKGETTATHPSPHVGGKTNKDPMESGPPLEETVGKHGA